jgi:hypothetical protein
MTPTSSIGRRLQVEQLEGRETPAILFGVTPDNVIVTFDSAQPSVLLDAVPILGIAQLGEVVTDIDVRTTSGLLYGHSNLGRLYQINPVSGLAIPVGSAVPLPSINVGFDFDPRADLIRILGNRGENIVREASFGLFIRRANDLTYAPGDFSEGSRRASPARRSSITSRTRRSASCTASIMRGMRWSALGERRSMRGS